MSMARSLGNRQLMKLRVKNCMSAIVGAEILGLVLRERKYRRHRKKGFFGAHGIDKRLASLLPHRDGFYVELGANDGAFKSNSLYFELKKNWRGVLVEPAPNLFLSCLKRRGDRNYVAPVACVPFGYVAPFVRLSYANAMTVSRDLELDLANVESHLELSERYLPPGEQNFEFGALAATLTSILDDAGAPEEIDFLSLDVEGAELAVLQGVNFDKYKFKFMAIESRDVKRLQIFLEPFGYKLLESLSGHDFLFGWNLRDSSSPVRDGEQ